MKQYILDAELMNNIIFSMRWMIKDIDYKNKLDNAIEDSDELKKAKRALKQLTDLSLL